MELSRGRINSAMKIVLYGAEGIGKSTFAAQFPNPVFIDTEGSTKFMDVARTPTPSSWTMLLGQVDYFLQNPTACGTLVLDTADWAEQLCITHVCAQAQKTGIEDFGYGKGYTYILEAFGKLLNKLEELVGRGVHIVLNAHAKMRKFEQPDEMGAYDRWELKLSKQVAPMVKEWADMVLFASYKTIVVNVDGQGAQKGKNKAQGGQRVMHTAHHPCWDAKNRFGLPEELPFDFAGVAHLFYQQQMAPPPVQAPVLAPPPVPEVAPVQATVQTQTEPKELPNTAFTPDPKKGSNPWMDGIPQALLDLMQADNITEEEIRRVVFAKGHRPYDMRIKNYDDDFVNGWVIPCWRQMCEVIEADPNRLPF